ncbi:hypothetical protein JY719_18065 [Clostridioides difficile]|uniref:hypothetical protein n=1 Tax=Clostridioides difficile TaxID=1496 RepID=UPI0010338ABE|nr:hypothetical protein [Clostridioides difficile]MCI9897321.1 hypothetical protein [Clostridioides difficile]MCO4709830.1 hypothetical protein [Clostridioides difficile]
MLNKSNIKETVIKIVFQDEKVKHEQLIQELQNTYELKKLQNIKLGIENENENDFLSHFF